MTAARSTQIRGGARERRLGACAGYVLRGVSWLMRLRVRVEKPASGDQPGGMIFIFWHESLLAASMALRLHPRRQRQLVALTSASKDGAVIEHAMRVLGIRCVRGSTSRRGLSALMQLKRELAAGHDICITPDGPRGPRRVLQAGSLKLAQLSGCALVPVRLHCSAKTTLKSWDRCQLPWPGARIDLEYQAPIEVPRDLSEADFEHLRQQIETQMRVF